MKPNNCKVAFTCTDPKKCVHYKKAKVKNPCKTCKGKTNTTCNEEIEAACFARDEYNEQKQLCHHSKGLFGRCFNLVAQVQAITAYLKSIGIIPEYHGGLKCSAECAEKNPLECGADCKIKEV